MSRHRSRAKGLARMVGRSEVLQRAAVRLAALRSRSIVLLYHGISAEGAAPGEVVPSVAQATFRRHLEVLGELGDILPLDRLLSSPDAGGRARFAITFDDDDTRHVEFALPVLQSLGAPATFFLSGRQLHGHGSYWWCLLEQLISERGVDAARRLLGLTGSTAVELAAECEGTIVPDRLRSLGLDQPRSQLDPGGIHALASAGMQIGFHTVDHPVLTTLGDLELARTLTHGRAELATITAQPVDLLAYPHGKADSRVARIVRRIGFRAAFCTGGMPVHAGSDRFLLGRWEPGDIGPDDFIGWLLLRLHRPVFGR